MIQKRSKRVVIMAAGSGQRWGNYLGVPKQFAPVDGEAIIERTIRLLKERDINQIIITTPKGGTPEIPLIPGTGQFRSKNDEVEIDRFWGARDLVDQPVIFLYGDVYYTEKAIDTILKEEKEKGWHFWGRQRVSPTKPYGEIFAVKANEFVMDQVSDIRFLFQEKDIRRCIAWELFARCSGISFDGMFIADPNEKYTHFTNINDRTDDFDQPEEYKMWLDYWSKVDKYERNKLQSK